jgi:hypothetical protein
MYTIVGRRKLKFDLKIDTEHIHVLRKKYNLFCDTFIRLCEKHWGYAEIKVSLQNPHLCNKVFINKMKLSLSFLRPGCYI